MNVYEEEITLEPHDIGPKERILKYILSNDPEEIEKAVNSKIINVFPELHKLKWQLNTEKLNQKVKDMMNRLDVNYSMTIYTDIECEPVSRVAINWRKDDTWFFSGGVIIANEFFTYEDLM